MLRLDHISKRFRGPHGAVAALTDVSLTLERGVCAAIRGPSGSGKTTLLLVAGMLLKPSQGDVIVADQRPYAWTSERRSAFRAAQIGFVFQQFHLLPYLSIWDNVRTPLVARPGGGAPTERDALNARAQALIEQFGLAARARHVPAALSTGERQRAALARALLLEPALLLADEPTGNLDRENGALVLAALHDYAVQGHAVLLVTHDPEAAQTAQRQWRMADGRLET